VYGYITTRDRQMQRTLNMVTSISATTFSRKLPSACKSITNLKFIAITMYVSHHCNEI